MKGLVIALAAALCLGCSAKQGGGERMSEGERLYRANCASCHALRNPRSYDDGQWQAYVRKYGQKLNLSAADEATILSYLQSAN